MSKGDTRLILAHDIDDDQPYFVNMQNDNVMNDTRVVLDWQGEYTLLPTMDVKDTNVHNSNSLDVHEWNAAWIGLYVQSTGAPTTIQFIPVFTFSGGAYTYQFLEGLWASMFYEDTDTAAPGISRTFLLPLCGAYFLQFQVVCVGAGAVNYFTTRITVQPFRGNFVAAHA